jgi:hypothetical protein
LIVSGNVFANNSVHGKGSAVYMDHEWYSRACDGADPVLPHFSTFRNNTLFGNATLSPMSVGAVPPASLTGAIYSEPRPTNADPLHTAPIHEVSNSILYGNTHVTSIGLLDSDQFAPASDFAVHSSNVQYLSTIQVWPTSRPASAGYVGGENINQNPHFQDPLFGDFRLKDDASSGGVRSPCIDTGTDFIKAGDAGDVNEDSDYELSNGGEIPFALNRTDDFFQNFGIGTARVLGTPLPGNPYPIDMGAMERE